MIDFDTWFQRVAGPSATPHPWQSALAARTDPASRLIRIPTGMGKTLGEPARKLRGQWRISCTEFDALIHTQPRGRDGGGRAE